MRIDASTMDAMLDELVMEGADDWVMFLALLDVVTRFRGSTTTAHEGEVVFALLRAAVNRGLMEIGTVAETGFVRWNGSIDENVQHIAHEWERLERLQGGPLMGDVCWLANTAEGAKRAERLFARQGDGP